jgi:hypothetical protein
MIRTSLVTLALLAGCRIQHLGPDTGVAYRSAFQAQRESDPDTAPTFTADDAKAARAREAAANKPAASVPTSASILMPAPSSSSGSWPGAKGAINLEAK